MPHFGKEQGSLLRLTPPLQCYDESSPLPSSCYKEMGELFELNADTPKMLSNIYPSC